MPDSEYCYPVFGFALLFMAAGLLGVLLFGGVDIPVSFSQLAAYDSSAAVFPMMFVSIACGAISGFHATQSPMMARCLKSERLARPVFYAGFFRDVRKVDRARNLISKKEIVFLMRILSEGVESGDFDIPDIKEWAILITNSINGMDVPYIRDSLSEYGVDKEKIKTMLADLILNGIKVR